MLKMSEAFYLSGDYTEEILSGIKKEYALKDMHIEWGTVYEVTLQDLKFKCAYSDDEIRGIIKACVEIIRELIKIQANGYTRERFDKVNQLGNGDENDEVVIPLTVFADFGTARILELIDEIAGFTRVAGAHYLLLAGPEMKDAIYCVFDKMLDDPMEKDFWYWCLHFLIRGAMRMHGEGDI